MIKAHLRLVMLVILTSLFFLRTFSIPVSALDPIPISSPEQLNNIRNNLSGHYQLTNDIDMSSFGNWSPIGSFSNRFVGIFDGNGFSIKNITISNTQVNYLGLFGVIGAGGIVHNLQIKSAAVTGKEYVGICTGVNYGTISKVATQGLVTGEGMVGGLAGYNENIITNSYSIASVSGNRNFGGLVGWNAGIINNNYAASKVSDSVTTNYVVFDGVNDYIRIPHHNAYVTENFTIEAWFNWSLAGSDTVSFIVGKGFENFEIHTGGGSGINGIRFIPVHRTDDAGGAAAAYNDVYNILQPGWNHVASTWDYEKREVRVFLNGIPQNIYHNGFNQGTVATIPIAEDHLALADNTQDLYIGARNNRTTTSPTATPSFYFKGNISDVRFWNKARTAAEITADKDVSLTGREEGLIGYWKLNEASGIVVYDSTQNINHGTIIGGATREIISGSRGGLVGYKTSNVTNSYYDTNVAGVNDSGKGIPLTTAQMKTQSSFSGWDFVNTWHIINNVTYPSLFPFSLTIEKDESQLDPVITSPINFTATFDGPINETSFSSEDVVIGGTSGADNLEITEISPFDGTTYKLSVSGMTNDGTASVSIPEGKVFDTLYNFNLGKTSSEITYIIDKTPPTVSISSTTTTPTNSSTIPMSITFSEDVINFTTEDIQVKNGSLDNFTGSGNAYTVNVIPISDGKVSVSIPANVTVDSAGNNNLTSNDFSIEYDATPPAVIINQAATQSDPTNTQPISFIATFSEPILELTFSAEDLEVEGISGTPTIEITEITPNDGTTYHIIVSGLVSGETAILSLPEGKVTDAALNINTASTSTDNSVEIDLTKPIVILSTTTTSPTNSSPILVSITFSETVNGFELSDLEITNGSADNFSGTGTIYSVDITPTTEGLVRIELPENVAKDLAGNPNVAASSLEFIYDAKGPDATIEKAASQNNPTNGSIINFTLTFNEPIELASLSSSDISVSGSAGATTVEIDEIDPFDGTNFNVAVSGMTQSGTVTTSLPAGKVTDLLGNTNSQSISIDNSVDYDITDPTVTISTGVTTPTNLSLIPITIEFSEPVAGFELSDISVSNGTVGNLSGNDNSYTVDISPTEDGIISIEIPSGIVTDNAGNGNTAAIQFTIQYDGTPPTVTVEQSAFQTDPTNTIPILFTATFSEPIDSSSFTKEDVLVEGSAGASDVSITEISPTTFDIAVENILKNGTIQATIPADMLKDMAGNFNFTSTSKDNEVTYDAADLTVNIEKSENQPDPTNSTPILFTVQFNKPINLETFTHDDFLLEGPEGTKLSAISNIEPNDNTAFKVNIDGMTEDGLVTLTMPEGKVQDLAGNTNTASTSADNSVLYDTHSPQIDKFDIEKFYEGNPLDHFSLTFSEAMYNPEGDSDSDDVTNPANYLLVEWGENAIFDTTSCKDGWQEEDHLIKFSSVTYNEDSFVSTLTLPNKLSEGSYRLFVCGSATLYDAAMNPFNNGLDSIYNFIVLSEAEEEEGEEENKKTSQYPILLPETGFPVGQTTLLAKQQANQQYASTIFELEIPRASIRTSIAGVPFVNGEWDVSWLGNQAGYLYGSAYPTWQGNTVITGHVWNANNTPGIFFKVKTLKFGDLIRIHAYGMVYTYEVRDNRLVSENNLEAAFQSEEYDWVTLITCEGYQPGDKTYAARRMVRAVLVSVE